MTENTNLEISWKIDSSDRIVEINEDFEIFCRENRDFHFSGLRIGNLLHDALDCTQAIYLYRTLIYQARYSDKTISMEIRCDSPTQRRWYTLTIKRIQGTASVKFSIKPSKLEHRDKIELLDHSTPKSDDNVSLCLVCGNVNSQGDWKAVEHFVEENKLNEQKFQPKIKKTLCKNCLFTIINPDIY